MVRCKGITKLGKRCKGETGHDDVQYCIIHRSQIPVVHGKKLTQYTDKQGNTFKIGDCLYRLTVEKIRKHLWDKKSKQFKTVKYYSPQTYGGDRLRIIEMYGKTKKHPYGELVLKEEFDKPQEFDIGESLHRVALESETFTPSNDLLQVDKSRKIHKNWLNSTKPGPYKKYAQPSPYYYLMNSQKTQSYQVCAGRPLNTISEDCLDELDLWTHIK